MSGAFKEHVLVVLRRVRLFRLLRRVHFCALLVGVLVVLSCYSSTNGKKASQMGKMPMEAIDNNLHRRHNARRATMQNWKVETWMAGSVGLPWDPVDVFVLLTPIVAEECKKPGVSLIVTIAQEDDPTQRRHARIPVALRRGAAGWYARVRDVFQSEIHLARDRVGKQLGTGMHRLQIKLAIKGGPTFQFDNLPYVTFVGHYYYLDVPELEDEEAREAKEKQRGQRSKGDTEKQRGQAHLFREPVNSQREK